MDGFQTPESLEVARKRRMAELLMQQSQMPSGQMVSGHYIPPSITQQLAAGLNLYKGTRLGEQADMGEQELARALQQKRQDWMGQMPRGTDNTSMAGPAIPNQPTAEDYMQWGVRGMQIDPRTAQMGMQSANMAMNRESQAGARKDAQQARFDQLAANHQLRLETLASQNANAQQVAEANRQHQLAMAKLQASLKPEPLQAVLVPGSQTPVLLPRSEAVGKQPYNPAAAKTQAQEESKADGKNQLNEILGQLTGAYDTLKEEGGVTSTGGNPLTNLGARLGNTGAGQMIGSVMGTKAQEARQTIAQTRPLLLAAIKNATGMSAQQMNSNAEMQMYLKAATDPSAGYEANMKAISTLDRMYGLGVTKNKTPEITGQDKAALDWANANPNDPRAAQIKQKLGIK